MHRHVAALWAALLIPLVLAEVEAIPADECDEDPGSCALSALQLKTETEPTPGKPGTISVVLATEDALGHTSQARKPSDDESQSGQSVTLLEGGQDRETLNRVAACCRCAAGDVGFSATGQCDFCEGQVASKVAAPRECQEPSLLQSGRTACAQKCGKQFRRKSWYPAGFA